MNARHQHRCLVCFEKWDCLQDCDLTRGHHVEECTSCCWSRTKRSEELRVELERFAAFIAAIQEVLLLDEFARLLLAASRIVRSRCQYATSCELWIQPTGDL